MAIPSSPTFLHRVLLADATLCAAAGLALLALGGAVAGLLGLPPALLRGAGLVLLPVAAGVFWLARQTAPRRALVWALVALNLAWAAASLLLLATDLVTPSALGTAFILAQAMLVAGFALLEAGTLRQPGDHPARQVRSARP